MYGSIEVNDGLPAQGGNSNTRWAGTTVAVEALKHRLLRNLPRKAPDTAARQRLPVEADAPAEEVCPSERPIYEQLALVAHELRNSLGIIRNAAWLMQMYRSEPSRAEKAQQVLGSQIGEMARLVDDLLELSQVRSGTLRLQLEQIDLRVVTRHAIDSVEPEVRRRNHRLQVDMPDTPVWLRADAGRLAQVLVNLLANAAKYTDKGGELVLSVEREAHGVAIRVCDSGIGIAPEMLPHVFEPFVQAESARSRSERGIGIGLALVRTLVELHGGRVSASSAGVGMGSEFTVRLPTNLI